MQSYQKQDSMLTLSEGLAEYREAYRSHLVLRETSSEAEKFFRCHDAVHVLFGCGLSLRDELIVKISSLLATDDFWVVVNGYRLAESKEIYQKITTKEVVQTFWHSLYLVPRTLWRCIHMRKRWDWEGFHKQLDIPLVQLRDEYGVRVAH